MKEIGADTSWPWRQLSNPGSGPWRTPVAFACPATSPPTLRWGHRVPRSRWMGWGRGCPPCTCLPCPLHPPLLQERARGQASPTRASVETSRTPPDRLATFSLWPLSRGRCPPATSHPHLPAEKSLARRDAGTAGRATRRRAPAPAAPAAAPARALRPRETTNTLPLFDSAKRASRACAERSLSDSGVQEGGAWKTVRPRTTEGGRLPGLRARHPRAVTGASLERGHRVEVAATPRTAVRVPKPGARGGQCSRSLTVRPRASGKYAPPAKARGRGARAPLLAPRCPRSDQRQERPRRVRGSEAGPNAPRGQNGTQTSRKADAWRWWARVTFPCVQGWFAPRPCARRPLAEAFSAHPRIPPFAQHLKPLV